MDYILGGLMLARGLLILRCFSVAQVIRKPFISRSLEEAQKLVRAKLQITPVRQAIGGARGRQLGAAIGGTKKVGPHKVRTLSDKAYLGKNHRCWD